MGPFPIALQMYNEKAQQEELIGQVSEACVRDEVSAARAATSNLSHMFLDPWEESQRNSLGPTMSVGDITNLDTTSLRVISNDTLMRCFGRIFSDNVSSEEAFNKSELMLDDQDVDVPLPIDWFLSAPKSISRGHKFLSLAMFARLERAVIIALMAAILLVGVFILQFDPDESDFSKVSVMPLRPFFKDSERCNNSPCRTFSILTKLGVPVVSLLIVFLNDYWTWGAARYFYPKACAQQETEQEKVMYLKHLPALMYSTKNLVVVHTRQFLNYTESVFELAIFMMVQPTGDIVVINSLMKIAFFGSMVNWLCFVLPGIVVAQRQYLNDYSNQFIGKEFSEPTLEFGAMVVANVVVVFFGIVLMVIWHTHVRQRFVVNERTVTSFKLSETYCENFYERDAIQRSIVRVMRSFGYVSANADPAKVLRAFNHLVRKYVPLVLEGNISRVDMPYRYTLLLSQVFWWEDMDQLVPLILQAKGVMQPATTWREVLTFVLMCVGVDMCVIPLLFGAGARFLRKFIAWGDVWSTILAVVSVGNMTIAFYGAQWLLITLGKAASRGAELTNDCWLATLALVDLVLGIITYRVYRQPSGFKGMMTSLKGSC